MSIPPCHVCRERPAKYVCQSCGNLVCEVDVDLATGYCRRCLEEESSKIRPMAAGVDWVPRLFLLAFIVFTVGVVLTFLASLMGAGASAGGVVFIGPIPFVFGAGPQSGLLVLMGSIIVIAIAVFLLLFDRRTQ